MTSLPNTINYSELNPLPPSARTLDIQASPSNGQTFSPGSMLTCDFINRGYLIPDSLYMSYTVTYTDSSACELIGCPLYSPFSRAETVAASNVIDQISSYNILMNFLMNVTHDTAQKQGNPSYGYGLRTPSTSVSQEKMDGCKFDATTNNTLSLSGPLHCILTNSEKLIPLHMCGGLRINLTCDQVGNFFNSVQTKPTGYSITNFKLNYRVVEFDESVDQMVRSQQKLYIKSQSWASSSQTLPSASTGRNDLIFSMRYASIKSLYALNGSVFTSSRCGPFDSLNLVPGASYQFNVGGENYPSMPLETTNNKARVMTELRQSVGSIFDANNSLSINRAEAFLYEGTDAATTNQVPSKFYISAHCEKMHSNNLLTGVSSQSSPITYSINLPTATNDSVVITCFANHDAIIEIDTLTNNLNVRS